MRLYLAAALFMAVAVASTTAAELRSKKHRVFTDEERASTNPSSYSTKASRTHVTPDTGAPLNKWVVEFHSGSTPTDVSAWAQRFGLSWHGGHHAFNDHHIFNWNLDSSSAALAGVPDSYHPDHVSALVAQETIVAAVHRQVNASAAKKSVVPDDPQYYDQWHLANDGSRSGVEYVDLNVFPAWNSGYKGAGVTVAIVDDGVEYDHDDFDSGRYFAAGSYDYNGDDSDPSPGYSSDAHGTACAGLIAAGDNDVCGVGLAPECDFAAIRLISGGFSDLDVSLALTLEHGTTDIYSNSWGPPDNGMLWQTNGPLTDAAFVTAVTSGRGGLGSILTWAAGNGEAEDNSNLDGFTKRRETIAVAAVGNNGQRSWFSEPGSNILIACPSNNENVGVVTTDITGGGYGGYADDRCTSGFGGTSAATPMAAGGIALMLEANSGLGWRDVQWILALTAAQTDPTSAGWSRTGWGVNGAGLTVHDVYGHGLFDVGTAVATAETWNNVGAETEYNSAVQDYSGAPLSADGGVCRTITTSGAPAGSLLEHVEVDIVLSGANDRDFSVTLQSPAATFTSTLMHDEDSGVPAGTFFANGTTFSTVAFFGENPNGDWTLCVEDHYSASGTLDEWSLRYWYFDPTGSSLAAGVAEISSNRPAPGCGNGVRESGEECDDVTLPAQYCNSTCGIVCGGTCGNGDLEVCEECEPGRDEGCLDDCTFDRAGQTCEEAAEITRFDYGYDFDNSATATEGSPTLCAFAPTGKDLFYSFVSPSNGTMTVDTCDVEEEWHDTVLEVFSGDCDDAYCVAWSDDQAYFCDAELSSMAEFEVVAGVKYTVRVTGYGGGEAAGELYFDFEGGPFCGDGDVTSGIDEECDPLDDEYCSNACTKLPGGDGEGLNVIQIIGIAAVVILAIFAVLACASWVSAHNSEANAGNGYVPGTATPRSRADKV